MSRATKQILYGLFYIIIFALIGLAIYFVFIKAAPSCFDNRQNQREEGIDCGGSCMPCEIKTNPIAVQYLKFINRKNFAIILAELQNSSLNYAATRFFYEVYLNDAIGNNVFRTGRLESFIYAAQAKKIIAYFLDKKSVSGVSWQDVDISTSTLQIFEADTQWAKKEIFIRPDVRVTNYNLRYIDDALEIKGTIKNLSDFSANSVEIIAFISDGLGDLRGLGKTAITDIRPLANREFAIIYSLEAERLTQLNAELVIEAK